MANIDNIDDATTVRELEVNDTVYDIVGKGVLDQNNRTTNLEWIGTKAEYEALGAYSDKCTYIITDDSADSQSDEVGAIAEEVNALKGHDYVVDWQVPTSANDYTWYRKYKSGWVEQGGLAYQTGSSASVGSTVVLPVEMSDGNYFINFCNYSSNTGNGSTAYVQDNAVTNVTTTAFTFCRNYNGPKRWQVSGMAA